MGRWHDFNRQQRRNTIKDEVYQRLSKAFQEGQGRPRHEDKKLGLDRQYIYTSRTYETYKNECKHFRLWIAEHHPECKHLRQCQKFVDEWLQSMIDAGLSAYTISTRKAAVTKLFGVDYSAFMETPKRLRKDITRSRYSVEYDKHISAKTEAYWSKITAATGLRISELLRIRGTDVRQAGDTYYLHVHRGTKGGKERYALILDNDIARMIQLAGDRPVFPNVPKAYDNHHYRGEYAKKLYNRFARPVDAIPPEDRYIMRKDKRGVVLDKKAMKIVSECLGHNRLSIIAQSYLY